MNIQLTSEVCFPVRDGSVLFYLLNLFFFSSDIYKGEKLVKKLGLIL